MSTAAPAALASLLQPDQVLRQADALTFQRGERYAREGRVQALEITDTAVRAKVSGTSDYAVELRAVKGRLVGECSCPVGITGAFCKHCVAAALAASAPEPAREPSPPPNDRFVTDSDLDRFIEEHGLQHVRFLTADVMATFVPERERASLRYVLGRQRLTDFATEQSLRRYGYALAHAPKIRDLLPPAAFAFLHRELDELKQAHSDARARCTAAEDPDTHELFTALCALRSTLPPGLPPRPDAALAAHPLRFDETLPGFIWRGDRLHMPQGAYGPHDVVVDLALSPGHEEMTCHACKTPCVHVLGAIDAALWWLHQPLSDASREVLKELRRPPWDRALRAIDRAMEEANAPSSSQQVTWRIAVHGDDGIDVAPYVHRVKKNGVLNAGARVSPHRLVGEPFVPPEDRALVTAAVHALGYANRALLEALVGNPRVFLETNPAAQVRVERVKVGLYADHRGDQVVLVPALDGSPLPSPLAERVREEPRSEKPLYLFEESERRLTLLDVPTEVRRTLQALSKFGNGFPPESHAALVEKLSSLSARVPVAMPRSVLGEAVPPQTHLVLRLEILPGGSVRAQVRIRPLPESATFLPGDGARDVHVRRNGRPLHARRDFLAEEQVAQALFLKLPRADLPPDDAFTLTLPDAQRALTFLSQMESWEDGKPELEWVGQRMQLIGTAAPPALRVQLEKKRDWFGVTGGLAVEGERVQLAVLLDAARRRERFIKVSEHSYVEVSEALRRQLERLADHAYHSAHGVELGPSAVEALDGLRGAGAKVDADKAWRDLSARIFAAKELKPRVPSSLKAELRDYQVEGFQWLSRLASWGAGAVLADDMGLGKTVQALAVLLERAKLGPALVVAPTSVGFNWMDEAQKFAPSLRMHIYAESGDRGGTLGQLKARDVLVVSYGLLARDAERLSKVAFSTIVFDEAQAVKNAATARAKAARALQGDFKFALSGTPLENHLGELWSIYRIVFPGLLGSWEAFRDRFATPIEKKIDPTAAPALSRVLQPFLLRRTKQQVAQELPPRTEQNVPVVLSAEEWQLYEDARLSAISELETPSYKLREQQRRVQVLAALTRLRLLASHPRLYDPKSDVSSSKLRRLLELIDELREEGHRALVFSQFTSHLSLVREVLDERGLSYLYLDGSTPRKERADLVKAFQEGDAPLFLISLKAGGFGLNLTGADNVIHLDPWWNPAVEDQASDRAHRIGQYRPVTIYRLVAKGTIEEQILSLHEDKRRLVSGVLDGTDQAARLTTSELLAMLSAPAQALVDLESPSKATH